MSVSRLPLEQAQLVEDVMLKPHFLPDCLAWCQSGALQDQSGGPQAETPTLEVEHFLRLVFGHALLLGDVAHLHASAEVARLQLREGFVRKHLWPPLFRGRMHGNYRNYSFRELTSKASKRGSRSIVQPS